jgi:hypothetical protein
VSTQQSEKYPSYKPVRWHRFAKEAFLWNIPLHRLALTAGIDYDEALLYLKRKKKMSLEVKERFEMALKIYDYRTLPIDINRYWNKLHPGLIEFLNFGKGNVLPAVLRDYPVLKVMGDSPRIGGIARSW